MGTVYFFGTFEQDWVTVCSVAAGDRDDAVCKRWVRAIEERQGH